MGALQLSKNLSRTLFFTASSSSFPYRTITTATSTSTTALLSSPACHNHIHRRSDTWLSPSLSANLLRSPWSLTQHRGIRVSGSDVKVGNVIEKKGRIYQVVKTDHSHEGRGKATRWSFVTLKVETKCLNDWVPTRVLKLAGVFVQEKTYMYMCTDRNGTIVLMDVKTFDQLEVSQELFGKDAKYLEGEMRVIVRLYDDIPLSASVPKRVTCIVKEAQDPMKGVPAPPKDKKVVLENGLTVEVPMFIVVGDAVVINTETDSYVERAKA